MKRTWFRHHDLTSKEADELIQRYNSRNVLTKKILSADPKYWIVMALLPEVHTGDKTDCYFQSKL